MAARAAAGATLGILAGCVLWIWSAWPDSGLAVSVLGVTCALFGNVDAPAREHPDVGLPDAAGAKKRYRLELRR